MKKLDLTKNDFDSKWFCITLLSIGGFVATLEIIALLKGQDGTMFGATMAGLGGIGGYLLKGFLKK